MKAAREAGINYTRLRRQSRHNTFLRGLSSAEQVIGLLIGCMGGGWRRIQVLGSYVALLRIIVSLGDLWLRSAFLY